MLQVRQGSGYVVRDFHTTGGPDLLPGLVQLARDDDNLVQLVAELLFVRRHLARAVLERVNERAANDHLAAISARIREFAEAVEAGRPSDELAEIDLDVLRAILAATQSPVLQLMLNPVVAVLAELPELANAMYCEPQSNVVAYQLLLQALESRADGAPELLVSELQRRDQATLQRLAAPSN